ncbi:putative Acyl-CoA N-acyltransferase (fragment) [Vibrio nigripulchritudo SFn118]
MKVRKAIFEDAPILLDLINKKADFDRSMRGFEGEITTSVERIQKTFFNPEPFAHAIILELSGEPIGFAIFHYRYSSFSGLPSVWLDDLLVLNTERSKGHGRKVMAFLKELAQEKGGSHIS